MLWLVYRAMDWEQMRLMIAQANWWWLALAWFLFHSSQVLASIRFAVYVEAEGAKLSMRDALALNYIGTTLNLALPSGIGGDGYKGLLLIKRLGLKTKRVVQLSLSNRLSGLTWLVFWAIALLPFAPHIQNLARQISPMLTPHNMTLIFFLLWVLGMFIYVMLAKKLLGETWAVQRRTAFISCALQASVLLCAFAIARALGIPTLVEAADMLIVFMVACVLAVLPFSVGGLGLREVALLYGTQWLGLDHARGVALASLFFILYTTSAIFGVAAFLQMKKLSMHQPEALSKESL